MIFAYMRRPISAECFHKVSQSMTSETQQGALGNVHIGSGCNLVSAMPPLNKPSDLSIEGYFLKEQLDILLMIDDGAAAAELAEFLRLLGHCATGWGAWTDERLFDFAMVDVTGHGDWETRLALAATRGVSWAILLVDHGTETPGVTSIAGVAVIGILMKPLAPVRVAAFLRNYNDRSVGSGGPQSGESPVRMPGQFIFRTKHALAGDAIVGYEAVAWQESGRVSPDPETFTGTIWAAEAALGVAGRLARARLKVPVAFSCPPNIFTDIEFVREMQLLTRHARVDPDGILVDVETGKGALCASDLGEAAERCVAAGFPVALGTQDEGTAGWEPWIRLPLSEIRLDGCGGALPVDDRLALQREIVALCRQQGIRTTIGRIGSGADLRDARTTGADQGLGAFWGGPLRDVIL